MDSKDRSNLKQLIDEYDIDDTTNKIRDSKHSDLIKQDVNELINIKKTYSNLKDSKVFNEITKKRCNFLYSNYNEIFKKIIKDEIDLNILHNLLKILKRIELGELDQHEGSYEVGMLLKQLYVDKVIKKKSNKVKKKPVTQSSVTQSTVNQSSINQLSWADYKKLKM